MTPLPIKEMVGRIAVCAATDPVHTPVLMSGPPGIGKSDAAEQAVALLNKGGDAHVSGKRIPIKPRPTRLVLLHLVVMDPTDLSGIPATVIEDGVTVAEYVPLRHLKQLMHDDGPLTIVFLDDLGQASPAVQAAAMQLVLARRLNGARIADNVHFIAATNRRQDKAGVGGIIQPLINRFASYEARFDLDSWSEWALERDAVDPELVAFVRWHETYQRTNCSLGEWTPSEGLENNPTPRGVVRMGRNIRMGLDAPVDVEAAVGPAMSTSWLAFRELVDKMPDIDAILADPRRGEIPADPGIQYALTHALFNRIRKDTTQVSAVAAYLSHFSKNGTTGTEKLLTSVFLRDVLTASLGPRVMAGFGPLVAEHSDLMIQSEA